MGQLGTSSSQTICTAGCAMSCVAMAMASYQEKINNGLTNPGNLNDWLINNNGYADSDLIIWSSVDGLGKVHFKEEVDTLSASDIANFVNKCYPVIVNVRSGTHWVLITGTTSNSDVFEVNDPYFSNTTYSLSDMSEFVVYNLSGSNSSIRRFKNKIKNQFFETPGKKKKKKKKKK